MCMDVNLTLIRSLEKFTGTSQGKFRTNKPGYLLDLQAHKSSQHTFVDWTGDEVFLAVVKLYLAKMANGAASFCLGL